MSHVSQHVLKIGDKLDIPGSELSVTVTGIVRHSDGNQPPEMKVELKLETDYARKAG